MEAGGSQGARQSQRNHPHLQDSIRGSSLIHLSCELVVMGRKGRVYDTEWVESLDEQESAEVFGVVLTGERGMLSPRSIQGGSLPSLLPSKG